MGERHEEFYVGYLPLPSGYIRFVRIAVPSLLWMMVAAAVAIGVLQRSPGEGVWDQGKPVERTGMLYEKPYPHVVNGTSVVFLVEQGKRGSQDRCRGLDGRRVRASGWVVHRDGREILELVPEDSALKPVDNGGIEAAPTVKDLGSATLRGEIVDYKCYLGAMKPGDGKAHKACAILCMTGGIPAMLVTHEHDGPRHTLLADVSGGPVSEEVIALAAEPVEVSGTLVEVGPVRMLKVREVRRR